MKKKIGGGFGISTRWGILKELEEAGIEAITGIKVKEIKEAPQSGVLLEKECQEVFIPAETVVLATGYVPNNALYKSLDSLVPEIYTIGDCVKVRTALEAIHEGFEVGLRL